MKKFKRIVQSIGLALLLTYCNGSAPTQKPTDSTLALASILQETAPTNTQTPATTFDIANTKANLRSILENLSDGSFSFDDSIGITSFDGVKIAANIFVPQTDQTEQKFPAVIFINSWALNEYEYLVPAAKLAQKGYIVLSYSTRGFGSSEGQINVAGPKDNADLGKVLDFLEANYPVDVKNIGLAGISYGSGNSLIGLALQDRVKTAAAMSGWASLTDALHGNGSTRSVWGSILLVSGYFTGTMDPIIAQQFSRLLQHKDIDEVYAWADIRSPQTYLEQINRAGKSVYISNNLSDELFQPNSIIEFFERLTIPKKLDLNQGIHATAEIPGIFGLENYVWNNVYQWFDYHLKGIDNGIMDSPQVSIEKKLDTGRANYQNWPAKNISYQNLYTHPRSFFRKAALKTSPYKSQTYNKIYSGIDTLATTGIPILSPILEGHTDAPVYCYPSLISSVNGIAYKSEPYQQGLKIRGIPKLGLGISLSKSKGMVNAYLYDVSKSGLGKLITHGTASFYGKEKNSEFYEEFGLVAVAYDLPAGHRLALIIDTIEPQYAVPTLLPYSIKFHYSQTKPSKLQIPVED